jgi:hypothetical protein
VLRTALDARRLGHEVTVVEAGCRVIDIDGSLAAAWSQGGARHSLGMMPRRRCDKGPWAAPNRPFVTGQTGAEILLTNRSLATCKTHASL